ncbi:recombinase family protein [Vibrio splendidus]|uniref:recombinase family protein n=1 Tax=Vibrio splendidus TaxID=29497 RepID=UPI0021B15F1E|nr:recombinase family protein [Vibrio splendidus]UXA00508.1 recombinase family protein [Vibrio splendidus]
MQNNKMINKTIRESFIYSRVSKSIQAQQGGGISRQIERGIKFVEELNRQADEQQKSYVYEIADEIIVDRGLSAYLGKNTSENAGLGAFLQAAREGKIPAHSLLVVEAVDRISRLDPTKARMIFFELAQYKIDIAIQRFNLVVYHDEKADMGSDLLLTAAFHLAHMESQQKSDRIRATFNKKREMERKGGAKRTTVCPAWMQISTCKTKFELIPDRVDVLKRIFKMRIKYGLGAISVANKLNGEGILNFNGRPWNTKLIEKYWKMPQCIGVFQPKTDDYKSGKRRKVPLGNLIVDYYPAAISKTDFALVQESFSKYEKGAKSHNCKNLYAGLLKCATCGGTLSFAKSNRGQPKLRCRNYLDGRGCSQGRNGSLNYLPVEKLLVDSLSSIEYSQLNRRANLPTDTNLLSDLEHELNNEHRKVGELKKQLENVSSSSAISALARELDRACIREEKLKQQQAMLLRTQSIPDLSIFKEADFTKMEERCRYNSFISSFVDYVVVSGSDCIVCFKGDLGCVQLLLDNRLQRLRERGYILGKDVIEGKFKDDKILDGNKILQLDLGKYVEKQNQTFAKLTDLSVPRTDDYLTSIKFAFNVQLKLGLCPSLKSVTTNILNSNDIQNNLLK